MSRRKIPRSVLYKLHLRTALKFAEKAERLMRCWIVKDRLKFDWNEEEKKALWEAQTHLGKATKIVGDIFAARIGKQAVLEASCGDDA